MKLGQYELIQRGVLLNIQFFVGILLEGASKKYQKHKRWLTNDLFFNMETDEVIIFCLQVSPPRCDLSAPACSLAAVVGLKLLDFTPAARLVSQFGSQTFGSFTSGWRSV